MKNKILLLITILITAVCFAQQGINYKALIKDDLGNALTSETIDVKFTIIDDAGPTDVYQETHFNATTDTNGIVILNIGTGTPDLNLFTDIDWSKANSLKVEIDIEQDATFEFMNTTQFMAVPYAKHAESSNFKTVDNVTSNTPGDLDTDDFVFGSSQLEHNEPDEGPADIRMFFDVSNGSFRTGATQSNFLIDATNGTSWNANNRGDFSFATGLNSEASGTNSFAGGERTFATGIGSTSFGYFTRASAQNAFSIGSNTNAEGVSSFSSGSNSTASGYYSFSTGIGTRAYSVAEAVFGLYNTSYTITNGVQTSYPLDRLFVIGNGAFNDRSDALIVLKNGSITAPSLDLSEITDDKSLITKEYSDANVFSGNYNDLTNLPAMNTPSGLEQITEAGKTGWRLIGVPTQARADIGEDAIDMSYSFTINSPITNGATGDRSFAIGEVTEASGTNSTAIGLRTTASGDNSMALGSDTLAESYNSLAIGLYNIGGGTGQNWQENDPLFEIGNGNSNMNRKNALTVLKNGKTGIGIATPSSVLEIAHQNGSSESESLSILNTDTNNAWQFHTTSYLNLFRNGIFRGSWNATSGAYVQASDRRVKKDIKALENGTLSKVMHLNPVSYLMKDQTDSKRNLGLISQEVKELFPSITHYVKDADILTLSYTELIPVLIKALQEQQVIIETQKAKDVIQDKSIEALVTRLNRLESKSSH